MPVTGDYGDNMGYLDTSLLTIIFIGAFSNLIEIRKKIINKKGVIGFNNQVDANTNLNPEYIVDDFIKGGFLKEFVGRFDTVIELNKLTQSDLENIIRNSKKSTFTSYIQTLKEKGLKLIYNDDIISEIAVESIKLNIGARGIKKVVQNMFKNIMLQILSDDEKYTECIITKRTVSDPTNNIFIIILKILLKVLTT